MGRVLRTAGQLAAKGTVPLLLVLVLAGWGSSLLYIRQVAEAQRAQLTNCQLHATQQFDAAITARTRASTAATSALQNLIITVFTTTGPRAAVRRTDLAAFAAWRSAVTTQEGIRLPPLPRTACG